MELSIWPRSVGFSLHRNCETHHSKLQYATQNYTVLDLLAQPKTRSFWQANPNKPKPSLSFFPSHASLWNSDASSSLSLCSPILSLTVSASLLLSLYLNLFHSLLSRLSKGKLSLSLFTVWFAEGSWILVSIFWSTGKRHSITSIFFNCSFTN